MTLATVPRYDAEAVDQCAETAIVVGSGIAGLTTARILADRYEQVRLLDRDSVVDGDGSRNGVPQATQPHLLLGAGRATLEDFFPGMSESVIDAGGLLIDWSRDLTYYENGGVLAGGDTRFPMLAASRPLLERVIRERIDGHPRIEFHTDTHVQNYRLDSGVVTGVETANETFAADLVVDASGRRSTTSEWLSANGFEPVPVQQVRVNVTYSSIRIERPPEDRRLLFVPPSPPRTRGGGAFPIENDRWIVTIQGIHGVEPPRTEAEFKSRATDLPLEEFGEVLDRAPVQSDDIEHYPFPASRWQRYDHLDRFPAGLLVIGDAIASLNPIYGQGMSIAALEALQLHHHLASEPPTIGQKYFDRVSEIISPAWRLAVGNDFRFEQTRGARPFGTDLANRYISRLLNRAQSDGQLATAFARVAMLERPFSHLVHPAVLWRAFRPESIESRFRKDNT